MTQHFTTNVLSSIQGILFNIVSTLMNYNIKMLKKTYMYLLVIKTE